MEVTVNKQYSPNCVFRYNLKYPWEVPTFGAGDVCIQVNALTVYYISTFFTFIDTVRMYVTAVLRIQIIYSAPSLPSILGLDVVPDPDPTLPVFVLSSSRTAYHLQIQW